MNSLYEAFTAKRAQHLEQLHLHRLRLLHRYQKALDSPTQPSTTPSKHCTHCERRFLPLLLPRKHCTLCLHSKCPSCIRYTQEGLAVCLSCLTILHPPCPKQPDHSDLFNECYSHFTEAKNSIVRNPTALAFEEFENARQALNRQFMLVIPRSVEQQLLVENFAWFCRLFLEQYKLCNQKKKERIVVVQSERQALKKKVFEEQGLFLREQMRVACLQGRFEDAAVMEQSLGELQGELELGERQGLSA